jgi:hypothetical protein
MSELEAFTPEPTFNTPEWFEWMAEPVHLCSRFV